jgi:POT family proton-dependent oligopeptide transporter
MDQIQNKQPAGLWLICAAEAFERFSYYAMRALLILYFVYALKIERADAASLYGTFTGLVYLSGLIGGYVADKFIGQKLGIIYGALMIIIGQFLLGFENIGIIYAALGFLIMGNGFFKISVTTLVGSLYEKDDPRRDGGFTYFYMFVNLGAFLAGIIGGGIGEKLGWRYGFWIAALAMVIGLIVFIWGKEKYFKGKGDKPVKLSKEEKQSKPKVPLTIEEWKKITVIFVLAFFVIFFWAAFEQSGAALNLFAYEHTNRMINIFGWRWEVPATWFQSLNPVFVCLFAPLFSKMWVDLSKRGKEPSTPGKFVWALWLLAAGYVVLLFAAMQMGPGIKVNMFYLVFAYAAFTTGELCLSPVGLSLVTKLAPIQFVGILMGVWKTANAVANKLAGTYSGLFGKISNEHFFGGLIAAPLVASVILILIMKPLKKWMGDVR